MHKAVSTTKNRIASRARIIYLVIPVFVIIIILGVGLYISSAMADDFSRRMSRQYSVEAAANFLSATNTHFVLGQQLAHSTTISRWINDEYDEEIRARAIEEIIGYSKFKPYVFMMFTVYETRNVYDLRSGFTEDDFVVWWQIFDGGDGALWFTNTRDAELPFNINIQRSRPVDGQWELYVWTNHRMYYEGRFVGVVTVGSPFDVVLESVFGVYDDGMRRGYIIDYDGLVRVDSSGVLILHNDGLSAPDTMPETLENPALSDKIYRHLQTMVDGAFPVGGELGNVISLQGEFRYAAIAPIVGTNWSTVVLSGTPAALYMRYMPLMIFAAALIMVVLLLGGFTIQRAVLSPLQIAMAKEKRATETQQLMYESISIPSTVWDINGNLIDCNKAMSDFLGLSSKKETIRRYYEFTPEYQACGNLSTDICKDELDRLFKTGNGVRKRWLHNIDGEIAPVEVTMTRVSVGDTFICVCYSVDLRPIEAAMAKEREAYAQTQLIMDLSPTMINKWDRDLKLVKTNKRAVEWYRVSSEEEYLNRFAELAPECQPCGTPTAQKAKELVTEAFQKGSVAFEWITKTADGEHLPIWVKLIRSGDDENAVVYAYTSDLREIKKLEAQLREQKISERIQRIMEASPSCITCYNPERVMIDCNEKAVQLFGLDTKENFMTTFNNRFYDFFPPYQPCGTATADKVRQVFDNVEINGRATFEFAQLTESGENLPTEITLARVDYDDTFMFVSYLRDLRETKAQEEAIREAHEWNKELIDSAPYIINVWDENDNISSINAAAAERFGLSDAQVFVERFNEFSPEIQPCGTPSAEKAPALVQKARDEGFSCFEWMHQTLDGEPRPSEIIAKCVMRNGKEIVLIYNRDLREEKIQEEKVREANELNRALLDLSPHVIGWWDDKGNLLGGNELQTTEFFGIDSTQELVDDLFSFSPELQPCGTPTPVKAAMYAKKAAKDGFARFEWMHQMRSGELVPVEVSYKMYKHKGQDMMFSYTIDLRQIKKAEEERKRIEVVEESNRAKSAFLARMSHEIRTPITAVMGISEIELQNPDILPHIADSFTKILNSANLLLGIVNDILDISKIESGKMELAREEYDVASLVVDTAAIHSGFANNKSVEYNVYVDESLPARLVGDSLRIAQIINNVLSNAFKYTIEGSVGLSFDCKKDDNRADFINLQISVKDTGLGMTAEQLEDLDNEYTRYHERNYRFIEGTGLGMPIVYNLAKLMDAKVSIESTPDVGTTVVVTIPQQITDTAVLGKDASKNIEQFKKIAEAKKFTFTPEPMPYGSVLVVDDVDANLYVATGLLSFYDIRIETCNNGFDAIKKIKQGKTYDLVFMDYMMPGLSGTETMRKMRDAGYTEPIVALTANAMIGVAEEFIKEGFDDFVSKPIQTKQLNAVLLKYVKAKQPPDVIEAAISAKARKAERSSLVVDINNFQRDPVLLAKLREDFAKRHGNTYESMSELINSGDINTAHRLAHTIKGVAGLLYEDKLAAAAKDIEYVLASKGTPTSAQLTTLGNELNRVLSSIGDTQPELTTEYVSADKALSLLDSITPLLESKDVNCLKMLDEIRKIPQSDKLCAQIEDFDFIEALETAKELRARLDK